MFLAAQFLTHSMKLEEMWSKALEREDESDIKILHLLVATICV